MPWLLSLITLSFSLCLLSCSSQKVDETGQAKTQETPQIVQSGDSKPTPGDSNASALRITPESATRDSTLSLTLQGAALADAKMEWLVNGTAVANSSPTQFRAAETKKGDKVQAKATTVQGKEILSNAVQIRNAPPEIVDAKLVSEAKGAGALSVEVSARDADGDGMTLQYDWSKNGEPAGSGQRLAGPFKKGDKVTVRITPFDGEEYGNTISLQREIANLPPTIIDDRRFSFDGKIYTYQIRAADPEGDPLTYSLISGPQGMTIDPATGLIRWDVPPSFVGRSAFIVCVTDGHGGECRQNLTFDIKAEKK